MFQKLQTCSDVSRFLKKCGLCFVAGRRVPEKWFYTARNAEDKSIAIYTSDFKERRTCPPYWAFCEGAGMAGIEPDFGRLKQRVVIKRSDSQASAYSYVVEERKDDPWIYAFICFGKRERHPGNRTVFLRVPTYGERSRLLVESQVCDDKKQCFPTRCIDVCRGMLRATHVCRESRFWTRKRHKS